MLNRIKSNHLRLFLKTNGTVVKGSSTTLLLTEALMSNLLPLLMVLGAKVVEGPLRFQFKERRVTSAANASAEVSS